MDSSPYFDETTTQELQRLVEKLGGGWRYDQGVMPVVVLTLPEAQALERRLDERSPQ